MLPYLNIRVSGEESENKPDNSEKDEAGKKESIDTKLPLNSRRRISKFCLKPSDTLKLSSIRQEHILQLQEMLAKFGTIKSINSTHITKG